MVEFLETMPFWYWFVFAVILLIVEISTGTTYFLWPAAAAVIVGFADLWPLDGAWRMQLLIFGVITVLLTIVATPKVKPWLHKSQADHLTLNERGAQKIGKRVKVDEAFSAGEGRVRYGDTVWLAASKDGANFEKGAEVEIVGVDGAKLYVKAV
ncbi:MAG: NfeD family protein [Parvularculaceae bacterium]|nr:NfeD family protein [Parvularculaceae bacterium]